VQSFKSGDEVIHFMDEGPRSGLTVIFVNSLGTDLRVWDSIIKELNQKYRTVRFDKRGHGLSTNIGNNISISILANDLKLLISKLEIKNILLVGLSIGGLIALEFLKNSSTNVKGLVLSDTAAKIGSSDMWSERISRVKAGGIAAISDDILARWFSNHFLKNKIEELQLWRSMLTRTSTLGYLGCCKAIADCDLRNEAKSISIPTLLIVGDEDGSTPVNMVKDTANMIKNSEFKIIKGAGHLPCVEKPEIFTNELVKFLGKLD
jgi:3-oxoadipate enol-lactonase